jgi:D-apionolactonase
MILKTKNLTCQYQNGNLRYIKSGKIEIVRMIYTAVRDQLWLTANMTVFDEKIEHYDNGFNIKYKAQYVLNGIDYQAFIRIEGTPQDTISFHFEGEAQSDFLRNRIGLCVLHPIRECAGQAVFIENKEGGILASEFPKLISPHQPFLNIQKMTWHTEGGIEANLNFKGDIFETEDQRNWTDGSYKTYSTPLSIPFPVAVKKGEKVSQSVVLQVKTPSNIEPEIWNLKSEIRYPFPKIGYARSKTPLNPTHIEQLKQVPFDHYRVECFFEKGWKTHLKTAFQEAKKLDTTVELVVILSEKTKAYWEDLKAILEKTTLLKTVLFIGEKGNIPPQYLLDFFIPQFKNAFSNIQLGAGTDAFFAQLNRNRPTDTRLDFISFPINPQVHLTDNQTLIENLEAQKYTLETAQSFFSKDIHVSPITLKWRHYPNSSESIDPRQHTPFATHWTALSIKYLAAAKSLTFFETLGKKGILNEKDNSPLHELLKKIKAFQPVFIIQNEVENPLKKDSLIVENEAGERLTFEVMFNHLY